MNKEIFKQNVELLLYETIRMEIFKKVKINVYKDDDIFIAKIRVEGELYDEVLFFHGRKTPLKFPFMKDRAWLDLREKHYLKPEQRIMRFLRRCFTQPLKSQDGRARIAREFHFLEYNLEFCETIRSRLNGGKNGRV